MNRNEILALFTKLQTDTEKAFALLREEYRKSVEFLSEQIQKKFEQSKNPKVEIAVCVISREGQSKDRRRYFFVIMNAISGAILVKSDHFANSGTANEYVRRIKGGDSRFLVDFAGGFKLTIDEIPIAESLTFWGKGTEVYNEVIQMIESTYPPFP
jgi:hypothetical protein